MLVEIIPEKDHPLFQNEFGKHLVKGEPVEVPVNLLDALITSKVIKKKPKAKVVEPTTNPAQDAGNKKE